MKNGLSHGLHEPQTKLYSPKFGLSVYTFASSHACLFEAWLTNNAGKEQYGKGGFKLFYMVNCETIKIIHEEICCVILLLVVVNYAHNRK
jgi:hypothetical protein